MSELFAIPLPLILYALVGIGLSVYGFYLLHRGHQA